MLLTGQEFVIANVYASCELNAKQAIWDRLTNFILHLGDVNLCVCGDFNSVRTVDKRRGRNAVYRHVDTYCFNNFIDACFLVYLPICVRLFTWYHSDGFTISRLDRFLLSAKWCESWPNCVQVAYQRGLSDHVPLVLHVEDVNWGP